jgi:hypothetical protein
MVFFVAEIRVSSFADSSKTKAGDPLRSRICRKACVERAILRRLDTPHDEQDKKHNHDSTDQSATDIHPHYLSSYNDNAPTSLFASNARRDDRERVDPAETVTFTAGAETPGAPLRRAGMPTPGSGMMAFGPAEM